MAGPDFQSTEEPRENGDTGSASDEIELVYVGLMRNVRGAQASAAHWEARRLSDDDIAELGYAPEADLAFPNPAPKPAGANPMSDPKPKNRDQDTDTPHARHAKVVKGKPDQLRRREDEAEDRQEALIDEGLEETFPASDPVSVKRIT